MNNETQLLRTKVMQELIKSGGMTIEKLWKTMNKYAKDKQTEKHAFIELNAGNCLYKDDEGIIHATLDGEIKYRQSGVIDIKYKYGNQNKLKKIEKGNWIDLYAAEDHSFKAGDHYLLDLGVAMQLPDGYEAWLAVRSSTFRKTGLQLANGIGIIDNAYNGDNDWWKASLYATRDTRVKEGDRLFQFRLMPTTQSMFNDKLFFNEVRSLDNEDRGGFGSTDE